MPMGPSAMETFGNVWTHPPARRTVACRSGRLRWEFAHMESWALRCFGWVVAHASVVMRWLGTGELGGPTGAIVPSPDVAGGVLPVDLWTTRLRCPQIHRHRDYNS